MLPLCSQAKAIALDRAGLISDFPELHIGGTMVNFFNRNWDKYRRYREATEFIRAHGCTGVPRSVLRLDGCVWARGVASGLNVGDGGYCVERVEQKCCTLAHGFAERQVETR